MCEKLITYNKLLVRSKDDLCGEQKRQGHTDEW